MKFASLVFAAFLLFAFGAKAQTTNDLSQAEIQGRQLAQDLLQVSPTTNFTQRGFLKIEDAKRSVTSAQIILVTVVTNEFWKTIYLADQKSNDFIVSIQLFIIREAGRPNEYFLAQGVLKPTAAADTLIVPESINENQIWAPFAGSDFWIADLGLEFFHWPDQNIIKHETRRTRACAVLESTNPHPAPGGYSRVDTWIDNESLGIVHAEAYDADGKLLKIFDPKKIKKVNGQWELEDMEIQNVQTRSRTWIKFNLEH